MDTIVSERCAAVVADAGLENDPVRGIDWISIATLILPMLFDMPCFASKSPEQQRKWIERNPNLARAMAARKARQANRNITKEESFKLADSTIESFLTASEAEIRAFTGVQS
jgi:hypothetical protein